MKNWTDYFKLNEGSWGNGPLDNDATSDWKWKFGAFIYKEINDELNKAIKSENLQGIYHCVGMWEYFRDRHAAEQYNMFKEEEIENLDSLSLECVNNLLENLDSMGWKEPESVKRYLNDLVEKFEQEPI
jgi:hypothetical protein